MGRSVLIDRETAPALMLRALERQGFELAVCAGRLRISPAEAVTPTLLETLAEQKAYLLPIVQRLVEMRRLARVAPRPLAYARADARPAPGFCFSCGDQLERPEYNGRCPSCDIAADIYYAAQAAEVAV